MLEARGDSRTVIVGFPCGGIAVVGDHLLDMFKLVSSLRFYSSRLFHHFASAIEEWIASEVLLYGVRPTARPGEWLMLLPQNGKDSCRCLAARARSKQPKAPTAC